MKRLMMLAVLICGLVITPTSATGVTIDNIFISTNSSIGSGFWGGDWDPVNPIDWSIGNSVPFNPGTITNDIVFSTNVGALSNPDDWIERMRIDSTTGNVGIGTTSPSRKIDVNGDARIRNLSSCAIIGSDSSGNLICDAVKKTTVFGGGYQCNPSFTSYCYGNTDVVVNYNEDFWYPADFTAKIEIDYGRIMRMFTNNNNIYIAYYWDPTYTSDCKAEVKISSDGSSWVTLTSNMSLDNGNSSFGKIPTSTDFRFSCSRRSSIIRNRK